MADQETRLLILGSLPGEQSLAQSRYYAHPRNQFWRLVGEVLGMDLAALAYGERLEALLEARIGLWDVIASATRPGSLDAAIRDHEANALPALVERLPKLRAVAFNGGKSFQLGSKLLAGHARLALVPLPSSSPALTLPFERKAEQWIKLREWLG